MSEKQYVIFKLGKEEFGIDIMDIQEIGEYREPVKLPDAPSYIEGVINHRGNIIPIINLRNKLSLENTEPTVDTRIIVISLEGKEMGFVVDEVTQTIRLNEEQVDATPTISGEEKHAHIIGLGKIDEKRLLILIDIEKVMKNEKLDEINEIEKNKEC